MRRLSLRLVSGVIVPRSAQAVEYGTVVGSPGDPVAPELASVVKVVAALHSLSFWSGHVGILSSLLADKMSNSTVSPSPTPGMIW